MAGVGGVFEEDGEAIDEQRLRDAIEHGGNERLKADFGLAAYLRTSAREGTNVERLRAALLAAIDWARIPEVTSTKLFAPGNNSFAISHIRALMRRRSP